ncbi:MAG: S-adenosylmethionine:tRNA ribosyltransferase-isomerase [Candidatus Peribacteria bacterium]|nr:MAG: S-adenosylmethionine:tRNA ribosyltransferase-isomerase [Candidatus Peribacteria bacterium]
MSKEFLTLHVGLGTFKPVHVDDITQYDIHSEEIIIPQSIFATIADYKLGEKNIIPVGTTMVRTLESLPYTYILLYDDLILTDSQRNFRETLTQDITLDQAQKIITPPHNLPLLEGDEGGVFSLSTKLYIMP